MLVGTDRKIDFGLDDMVKRFGIAFGLCARLFAVEHVIRTRSHFGDHFAWRAYALEWFYFSHGFSIGV